MKKILLVVTLLLSFNVFAAYHGVDNPWKPQPKPTNPGNWCGRKGLPKCFPQNGSSNN